MGRFILTTVAGAALAVLASTASAFAMCPNSESFFGTIQRVNGNVITVSTAQNHWADVRIERGAQVNTNGMSLRPGAYVGAYGCVAPNGVFEANEVTLSANDSTYHESLTGKVVRIEPGRLIVAENGRGYGTWFVRNSSRFAVGQTITATGMIGAKGVFYPQTINGQAVAFEPTATMITQHRTITLSGVVQRIGASAITVWEPSRGTSGEWVVRDPQRYHKGQRVTAVGTEDRKGHFYPEHITIQ